MKDLQLSLIPRVGPSSLQRSAAGMIDETLLDSGLEQTRVAGHRSCSPKEVVAALERASARQAPLWPLSRFVAVNPFLGLSDLHFEDAAVTLARSSG
ncbi:MAG: DUF2309 family protein, partial [Myxococcales bacterium]|nr:DUF2309 family protein [Myxococcales bacterium]